MISPSVQGFVLSPQQDRLWELLGLHGKTPFRTLLEVEIRGLLDPAQLTAAWGALVERHEILRTLFTAPRGLSRPLQTISDRGAPLILEDLASLDPVRRQARLEQIACELRTCPLPPDAEPIRAILVRLGEDLSRLWIAASSMTLDVHSAALLVSELGCLYEGRAALKSEAAPLQYADLAAWQQELLGERSGDGPLFWQKQGTLPPEPQEPPFAVPLAASEFAPATISLDLTSGMEAAAARLVERLGTSLEVLLLAAYAVWICRLTQREESSVGAVLDGRNYQELDAAIGPLARCILLRLRLGGAATFEAAVRAVESFWQEAARYQEYFTWEVPETPDGTPGPVTEVPLLFELQRLPQPLEARGALFIVRSLVSCTERFLLRLRGQLSQGVLHLFLDYDPDRLATPEAAGLAGRFGVLLANSVTRSAEDWNQIGFLSPIERHQALHEWNDTAAAGGRLDTLHRLVASQARRTPDAPAVLFEGESLTYRELGRRSAALASHLRILGVGPADRVALLLDRSSEMIVALLAVLEVGAAYVPLEPSHPEERIAGLVADSRPAALLTQARWRDRAPAGPFQIVELGNPLPDADAVVTGTASLGHPAYVLYTSGSTGHPKAVMISHGAIANRLLWMQETFPLGPDDSVLQKTPYSFDASIWEIFCPLISGARLVVARPGGHQDSAYLHQAVREHGVTVLQLVPSMLQVFLQDPDATRCASLRRLFCGGEAFPAALANEAATLLPGVALCNLYGPTEAAIDATFWPRSSDDSDVAAILPIGRPLTGVQVHILDRRQNLLPAGLAGELAIGGSGLAIGYHGRPETTAERFVPDSIATLPGGRLYRTGDLARRRSDGNIEFLGRIDHQVKVRGVRIELGEIESALTRHPAVREAAVALLESEGALVAYLVFRAEPELMRLPNGLEIAFLNRNETDVVYSEIFGEEGMFRDGLDLPPGACVFDVGANIGLFSLFIQQHIPDCHLYAFEPLPPIFDVLETNLALYGVDARAFAVGLSRESASCELTYYPRWSAMSGRYADEAVEKQISRAVLTGQGETFNAPTEALFADLFESRTFVCPITTLSEMIRQTRVERIDLLKVDVEKSELDVLEGIEPGDWPRIQRIFIEVHDLDGRLEVISELLRSRGFEVTIAQDTWLTGTEIWTLWARRPDAGLCAAPERAAPPLERRRLPTVAELRAFLAERLPDALIPSRFVRLAALPRLTNGKIDRRALPFAVEWTDLERSALESSSDLPLTPEEEILAGLWARLLPGARIGRTDNFFERGGHSLLAIQLVARIREVFGLSLSLQVVFERPTLAGLSAALFERRQASAGLSAPPLTRVPRDRGLPLSFAQERLWFLDRLVPDSAAYNLTFALRLQRPPSPALLSGALVELSRRHEALRTRFGTVDGIPVQIVDLPVADFLVRIDLSALPEALSQQEAKRLASEEARRPFDLARGPLFRAVAYRLSSEEEWLLLNVHHIVSDGWSTGLLLRDLGAFLEAATAGKAAALPPLPFQYADFASWERSWLSGETLDDQAGYWREQLAGAPALLDMPTDRRRPALQSFRGASLPLPVGFVDKAVLAETARRAGATGFMTVLTALGLLLHHYSGKSDLLVGSPVANRRWPEIQEVVGLFVNTLVFRLDLGGDPSLLELIVRVRAIALGAYAHQDLPFEKLVEQLQPDRNLGHQPLFQAMLTFQRTSGAEPKELGGLGRFVEIGSDFAKFDLNFGLAERDDRFAGVLEYCRDLFDHATAQRLGIHFVAALRELVERPEQRLSELILLGTSERHQILAEWNDTRQRPDLDQRIEAGFARQAAAHPDAIAVVDGSRSWSYGEVARSSDHLAWHLRSLGIGPGDFVAVFLDRALEMIPAVLGVLKAGAAYVPVETSWPPPRVSFVLRQLDVRAVVTQSWRVETLLEARDAPELAHILCLDGIVPAAARSTGLSIQALSLSDAASGPARSLASPAASPEDIAYVIFTSGSTGTPKGVVVRHRPVLNLIDWVNRTFDIGAADRVLFITSLSFDLSVYDIFGLLAAGGSIQVVSDEELRDPERLLALLSETPVTFWDSAPAALQQIAPWLEGVRESRLRLVFLSGDWIPVTLPDRVRGSFPGARVISLGGATEATVWSNVYPIAAVDPSWPSIPYGRPIQNARYYALDSTMEPCPIGVPGDLYIGDECLCSFYAQDPLLTSRKLVPNPFGATPGGRLYQTGDRVRFRADGNMEFLGRLDHQVKIRGFRIELGEIEAVLAQHPEVGSAAVLVREDRPGDQRLVAYVVPTARGEATAADLRGYLQARLPVYMVPAAVVFLEALPVTPNGKLDRRALQVPEGDRPGALGQSVLPRTSLERELVEIWKDVLGVGSLGVTDSFFDLGGHSLLAVRLMARIQKQLGRDLPLSTLFRASTVRELARTLGEGEESGASSLVAIQAQGEKPPLFCVHPIGGHVLCYVPLSRRLGTDQPVYGLEAASLHAENVPALRVEEMAARYLEEIRFVQPEGPYHLAGMSSGGVIAFEMAQQLLRAGEEVALLALLDSRPPVFRDRLDALLEDAAFVANLAREIELSSGRSFGLTYERLKSLDLDAQLALLLESMKEAGLLPAEVDLPRARRLVQLVQANLRAVESYNPAAYSGKLSLFRAAETNLDLASSEDARRILAAVAQDPTFGWSRYAGEAVEINEVPGDHLSMATEPHVAVLAERLRTCLDRTPRLLRIVNDHGSLSAPGNRGTIE